MTTTLNLTRPSRRTLVRGAAWSVPVIGVAAAAPAFAASQCLTGGGITVGPNVSTTPIKAICGPQSQWVHPGIKDTNYGTGSLPQVIEIRSCDGLQGWYRWREVDTRSDFQIEVDGVHSDQNDPQLQGYRPAFFLNEVPVGDAPAFKRFNLTYRTSAPLPTSNTNLTVTWTLQKLIGGSPDTPSAVWQDVQQISRTGSVRRNSGKSNVNFNVCVAGTAGAGAGSSSE